MVDTDKKNTERVWDTLLNSEKLLSDTEARQLRKELSRLRKENGFRQ